VQRRLRRIKPSCFYRVFPVVSCGVLWGGSDVAQARLLTDQIWKTVTSQAKKARNPAYVAVAYFGKGASKLLPLPPRSRLVVDASERAVSSGQTHPADLKKVQRRGATIYSVPNLHAKIYAFDKSAIIGSANASNHSARNLIEAVVQTDDRATMRACREFVRGLCLSEVTPGTLDRLQKIYRPPRLPGPHGHSRHGIAPELPRLSLVQLEIELPPRESRQTWKEGMQEARRKKRHRDYICDYFWLDDNTTMRVREKVIQITDEGRNRYFVTPPAEIINLRKWRRGRQQILFVYFEHPKVSRVRLESLARRIGYGAKKRLFRSGLVRNAAFKEKLLAAFGA
jgi:PLD-like domain